jgi:hypothetical protein
VGDVGVACPVVVVGGEQMREIGQQQVGQVGVDRQVRHRGVPGLPGPHDQREQHAHPDLPDRPVIAVGLQRPGVGIHLRPRRRRLRGVHVQGPQVGQAVAGGHHPHIGAALGQLPPPVSRRRISRDQRRVQALAQRGRWAAAFSPPDPARSQSIDHVSGHRAAEPHRLVAQCLHDHLGAGLVDPAIGQRPPHHRQLTHQGQRVVHVVPGRGHRHAQQHRHLIRQEVISCLQRRVVQHLLGATAPSDSRVQLATARRRATPCGPHAGVGADARGERQQLTGAQRGLALDQAQFVRRQRRPLPVHRRQLRIQLRTVQTRGHSHLRQQRHPTRRGRRRRVRTHG